MSNVNLLEALVASLEASHRIASEVLTAAKKADVADKLEQFKDFLDSVKKSDTDADAGKAEAPAEAPAPEAAITDAKPVHTVLMDMLEDERYSLRSASSLIEKSGFEGDADALEAYFEDNLVNVVRLTRRSDGAAMFGLASRN